MQHIKLFEPLRGLIATEDGLILFLLACIMVLETIDFLTGTFAAAINPNIEYQSKVGINGLIRKMLGFVLLTTLIPLSVLLPEQAGIAFLYTFYLGYIILTLKSLVENYGKAKGDTTVFNNAIHALEKLLPKREGADHDDSNRTTD